MSKKALMTLSIIGTALCGANTTKPVLAAEETNSTTVSSRATTKTATTTENLNLRSKANTSGTILTTIPKGKTVTLLSEKNANGWYKVSYEGKTGYVSGSYLKETTTTTTTTAKTTENLNLRSKANTSGSILVTIPKGKTITLLSGKDANGWYQAQYDGKTGYVSGSYLTSITSSSSSNSSSSSSNSSSSSSSPSTKTGTTTENLNLRDKASTSGTVLITIPKGKTVTLLSGKDANGWYKVSYNGKTGYASGSYITENTSNSSNTSTGNSNNNSNTTTPSNQTPIKGQTTENLNLRSKASTSGTVLATIPKGKIVTILADKDANGWYKVSYDGKTGYVSGDYLKVTKYQEPELAVLWSGVINANDVRIFEKNSTSSTVLGYYHSGQKVEVVNASGRGYQIKYKDGYAWIQQAYVTKGSLPAQTTLWKGELLQNAKLYTNTSTSSTVLKNLAQGNTVEVIEETATWLKVKNGTGYGYVQSSAVRNLSIPQMPTTILWTGKTTSGLNVRQTPDAEGKLLGTLATGATVEVLHEESNGWLQIKFNDSFGYVNGNYVQKDAVTETPSTPESNKQIGYVYNLDGIQLNVRPEPNTNQAAIGKLNEGDTVTILGESGNWYQIEYNNGFGYVSKDYVSLTNPAVEKKTGYVYNLDGTTLNVRPQPNTSQAAVGKLNEGDTVIVVGESGNWYEIEYNNSTAFVSKDYVTFTKPGSHPDGNINFEKNPRTGVVIDGVPTLNVRQAATTSSSILGTLTSTNEVTIVGRENDFYKIKYNTGFGYVHKDYVGVVATQTNLPGQRVSYLTTQYAYTLSDFAKVQQNHTSGTLSTLTNYLNPNHSMHADYLLQFLRIDQFRSFNVAGLNKQLENKGVLHNQAQAFYDAAKYYNIDPIFFVSQSIHETNWGTSSLAKGITITEIANENKPIKDSKGNIIDYERIPLDKPVTVYNLFGIGARDHAPRLLGTTYAYKQGWTTPEKAIFGAAEFISTNYINSSKYEQNTPFKIKFNHLSANQWHQYATTPWYAYEIGKYMHRFANLYDAGQEFLLDIPVYK